MYTIKAPDSAKEIFALEKECFPNDYWSYELIKKDLSSYFICKYKDEFAGYVCFSCVIDEAEITRIAVRTSYRREGIATKLIEFLKSYLSEKGCKTILLEVRASNLPAKSLYNKLGFVTYSVRKNYYHNPDEDAVLMSVKL